MRYQVPQFIETETKLIGPLTSRQFLWVAGGLSMGILEFMFLSGYLRIGAIILTLAFFGVLAFIKIEGQPAVNFLAYMLSYALQSKKYLFKGTGQKGVVELPERMTGQQ